MKSNAMANEKPATVNFNTKNIKKFKLVVLGNPNVGKTTLTYKLCDDKFLDGVEATIGVDLRAYVVNVEGEDIRLEIWDTAGQERFRNTLITAYYRNADAIIFVYDVTDEKSFHDLKVWIEESARNNLNDVPKVLIANKCDLPSAIDINLAQCFADANGMLLFETSSRSDSNCDHVRAIFYTLAHRLKAKKSLRAPQDPVISHSMLKQSAIDQKEVDSWCSC